MATEVITVCDLRDERCQGDVASWRLWHEGERTARGIDLCEHHASPLVALIGGASEVDLPVKPRAVMTVTKLKATEATRHLKK